MIFNILGVKSSTQKSHMHFTEHMWHCKLKNKVKANLIIMIVTHNTHFQGNDLIPTCQFHTKLYNIYASSFHNIVISAPNIVQRRGMKMKRMHAKSTYQYIHDRIFVWGRSCTCIHMCHSSFVEHQVPRSCTNKILTFSKYELCFAIDAKLVGKHDWREQYLSNGNSLDVI